MFQGNSLEKSLHIRMLGIAVQTKLINFLAWLKTASRAKAKK